MKNELKDVISRLRVRTQELPTISTPASRPKGYADARIEHVPQLQRDKIRAACQKQAWPLFLTGSVGTGKTCAAACVFGCFSRLPMWYRADDLLIAMSLGRAGAVRVESTNTFGEVVTSEIPYSKFVCRVANSSAVFLDDLGTRSPTEATYQALFDLLEWRKGKPLVITSNKKLSEIARLYDDRIVDRIATGTTVMFEGASRRQKMGKQ